MTVGANSNGKLGRDSDSEIVAADWPHSKTINSMDILRDNPYRGKMLDVFILMVNIF